MSKFFSAPGCGRKRMPTIGSALVLSLMAMTVSAATETRTFNPSQKFIAGFIENYPNFPDVICGIQLPVDADCYGRLEAWVRSSRPGANAMCASLLAAKAQQISVTYRLDNTLPGQCEIVRVET